MTMSIAESLLFNSVFMSMSDSKAIQDHSDEPSTLSWNLDF